MRDSSGTARGTPRRSRAPPPPRGRRGTRSRRRRSRASRRSLLRGRPGEQRLSFLVGQPGDVARRHRHPRTCSATACPPRSAPACRARRRPARRDTGLRRRRTGWHGWQRASTIGCTCENATGAAPAGARRRARVAKPPRPAPRPRSPGWRAPSPRWRRLKKCHAGAEVAIRATSTSHPRSAAERERRVAGDHREDDRQRRGSCCAPTAPMAAREWRRVRLFSGLLRAH